MSSPIEYKVRVSKDGHKYWYQNDKLHRLDGPAIEYPNGSKAWYQNGKLHRLDGPACELADGSKEWYLNDKLHREDGPAIEWADGSKSWYLNGKGLSHAKWKKKVAKLNSPSCNGKVVEIEGKKYRLMEVE